jgi:hypothetical protein
MENLPDEQSKRFVAVLCKKVETGRLMNALGHMVAGLAGGSAKNEDMCFLQYQDKEGGTHPNISHYPFIVLQADNGNQIRTLRKEALARGIPFTDFTSSMTIGTSEEQRARTLATSEVELEYYGICLFSDTSSLKELTKKFSLFR